MAKKKFLYDVTVEDYSMMDTFCNIPADTFREAAVIAKKRFVRRYWNNKLLKAHMEMRSDNYSDRVPDPPNSSLRPRGRSHY